MYGFLRKLKVILGIGLCAYEGAALAVSDPNSLPRLTDLAHRWPWLGRGMAAWCVVHLALPMLWPFLLRSYRVRRPARQP